MSATICHDCNFANCGYASTQSVSLAGTGYDNSASCLLISKVGKCNNGILNVINSCIPN